MVLITAWTIVLAYAITAIRHEYGTTGPAILHSANQPGAQLTGFRYQEFDALGLHAKVKADRLSILPRRFLFFNIKSINEAHLENAYIEIHLHDKVPQDMNLVPPVSDMFTQRKKTTAKHNPRRGFGLITRSLVHGISVKIFNADSLSIILLAESAYIDKRRHKPRFLHASLEDAGSGRRITSKEIIWDARDKEFLITGDYIMHSATGPVRGKDARVDLDFVVTPL